MAVMMTLLKKDYDDTLNRQARHDLLEKYRPRILMTEAELAEDAVRMVLILILIIMVMMILYIFIANGHDDDCDDQDGQDDVDGPGGILMAEAELAEDAVR